ncbi:MAG: chemotaxis protein CheW [Gammaproteobacteria bacterium]|nr:chemotaxis protein CheW [Gammaproteobacteria bacterium]
MVDTKEMATSGKTVGVVHCLTIPLHGETALLPNAAIAEVIAYNEPAAIDDAPEWFLGYMEWRDHKVPLISYEAISGREVQPAVKNSRIAVLNTLTGNNKIPYVGILTQGIPSLAIVQEQGLKDKALPDDSRQYVGAFVELGGVEALIPNIDEIEQRLMRLSAG